MDTDMATKRKRTKDDYTTLALDRQIGVRLTMADYARLEKLAVHLSVSTIARVALMLGLDAIEQDPGVLIGEKPKRR